MGRTWQYDENRQLKAACILRGFDLRGISHPSLRFGIVVDHAVLGEVIGIVPPSVQ
jgi:hypothetical protein